MTQAQGRAALDLPALGALCLILGWAAFVRLQGFDPVALVPDDQWVAFLVRHAGPGDLLIYAASVPMGFVAASMLPTALLEDPETALQVLPLICFLLILALAAGIALRLSAPPGAGVLAAALLAITPAGFELAVRVKQFTWDAAILLAILFLALPALRAPGTVREKWLEAVAAIGIVLSYLSVFVSIPILYALFLRRTLAGMAAPGWWSGMCRLFAFHAFLVVFWFARLAPQRRWGVVKYWEQQAAPGSEGILPALNIPLHAMAAALPENFVFLLLAAPVGLLWLARRPDSRWAALSLAATFVLLAGAGALGFYPVGGGRTDFFYQPLVALLVAIGAAAILHRLLAPVASSARTRGHLVLGLALLLPLTAGAHSAVYPGQRYAHVPAAVQRIEQLAPAGTTVLHGRGTQWPLALHSSWPLVARFDTAPRKFRYDWQRPDTFLVDKDYTKLPPLQDRVLLVGLFEGKYGAEQFRRMRRDLRRRGYVAVTKVAYPSGGLMTWMRVR